MPRTFTWYQLSLAAFVFLFWVWSAYDPASRGIWLLENILVLIFVPLLFIIGKYFRLSNVSYTLIAIYLCLHLMGAHYTYVETPLGYWLGDILGMERNMYDRFVHFSFGFLLAYPMREAFVRIARARGLWGYYIPVDITFAFSACYEIFEWLAMAILGEANTLAFLAAQNDIWDAQKDMTAAGLGAIVMMLVVLAVNWYYDRDFVYELLDEDSRTQEVPLGEQKISHVLTRQKRGGLFN